MSGVLNAATRVVGAVGQTVGAISQVAQIFGAGRTIDNSGLSFTGGTWVQQLQPASWRGCAFAIDAAETKTGRRVAVHEYPYRDDVWAEDLGRLPRHFAIQGWMVGDDVYSQRDAMLQASETGGQGTLVHPTMGTMEVVLLDFTVTDRRERGRVVEVNFVFVLAGDVIYPDVLLAAGQAVTNGAAQLLGASASDLGSFMRTAVSNTRAAVAGVTGYLNIARGVVNDATRIVGAVRGLQGYFGRFSTGRRTTLQSPLATVQTALSAATSARTLVLTTATTVDKLARLL